MFADKKSSFVEDFKNISKYWQKVTEPVIKQVWPIAENLIDLGNSRLIYDGCNAGIRIGSSGGKFIFYRNSYCNSPQSPPLPPIAPNPGSTQETFTDYEVINCETGLPPLIIYFHRLFKRNNYNGSTQYQSTEINKVEYPKLYPCVDEDGNKFDAVGARVVFRLSLEFFTPGTPIFGEDREYIYDIYPDSNNTGDNVFASYSPTSEQYTLFGFNGLNSVIGFATFNSNRPLQAGWRGNDFYRVITAVNQKDEPIGLLEERSVYSINTFCNNWNPPIDPPPPPKEKECDCMNCCPDVSNLEALLKIIIKRIGKPEKVTIFDEELERQGVQKTNKTPQSLNEYLKLAVERVEIANRIIGISNFPITVPETMIDPHKEGVFAKIFKFIDGEKKIKITTIAEFIVWMSKQDSAVLGEFHQVIEYETGEKDKKGKAEVGTIVLPNVAESLKEIVLLTAQMAKQNNIQTELIFKIAAEIVATRAVATKGTTISQDIQDYLDYPTDTKKAKIKTAVSLPKFQTNKEGIPIATAQSESLKDFLKPGEIEYIYDDWTGSNSLHDQLLDLLQLAAMLRAIYYQRTDKEEATIE